MKRLLFARNNILVEETPQLPLNLGEIQAQKDLNQFKENLINAFNDDSFVDETTSELGSINNNDSDNCDEYYDFLACSLKILFLN